MGSPPRMRGKPTVADVEDPSRGITPADAGKTPFLLSRIDFSRDHPRGCGENTICGYRRLPAPGSPPRMRGKLRLNACSKITQRITPADAGKTPYDILQETAAEDHPRGCGENGSVQRGFDQAAGSPPRMRGKHGRIPHKVLDIGITPADAGKTNQRLNACGSL